ncbi:MAG: FHA domain-containing protein [Deltaproteobacteria bacterium]|nr:FHA domain-containing protein [Deltaproteobacteria bacterium]
MQISDTKIIFSESDFPFAKLDDLFNKVASELTDGFILAGDKTTANYLFVIGGRPYSSGRATAKGTSMGAVKDFFTWYKGAKKAAIEIVEVDKKLLLCMLVMLSNKPSQQFTSDMINIEDIVKNVEKQSTDAIMAINDKALWSFAIFINGSAVTAFLPKGSFADDDTPLDKLLLYSHSLKADNPVSIELYTNTKVTPADDSIDFPEEGMATHFTKLPYDAYVELFKDGKLLHTEPIIGEIKIGRDKTNDIVLPEAGVSREHTLIRGNDDKYFVEDLKSANGTLFKGIRIETKELSDGDEIQVRDYTMVFHCPKNKDTAKADKKPPVKKKAEDLAKETIYAEPPEAKANVKKADDGAYVELDSGERHMLGSITTIGKDDEADIKVGGMLVAKRHATIIRGKGIYKIIKKGGISSIKVNNKKVDERRLRDGDLIEVGDTSITFKAGKK